MTRTAEATGPGPMALVAVEQRFPAGQRILVDELAAGCCRSAAGCC